MERRTKEIITTKASALEILNSARVGTLEYNFDDIKVMKIGGQGTVFEVKSKINGKIYAGKELEYKWANDKNSSDVVAGAEMMIRA